MNPAVDFYFNKATKWKEEVEQLRKIVLAATDIGSGLIEKLKWGVPCYMLPASQNKQGSQQEKNIVLIHTFKEYCALLFFKGALLNDPHGILIQQTKNVQAARQIRFTNVRQIIKMRPILQAYIHEAIEVEQAGLKVHYKKATEFNVPEEFQEKLTSKSGQALKSAFEALTPGRQRAYLLYFSAPKQSKTRKARIEKYTHHILDGKGLND